MYFRIKGIIIFVLTTYNYAAFTYIYHIFEKYNRSILCLLSAGQSECDQSVWYTSLFFIYLSYEADYDVCIMYKYFALDAC